LYGNHIRVYGAQANVEQLLDVVQDLADISLPYSPSLTLSRQGRDNYNDL